MALYVSLQDVREQAGFQHKVTGESLGDGDGSTLIFTVENFPIVDRNYSGTPATVADVVLYMQGSAIGVSAIVAATGKITAGSTPSDGSPMTVDYDWSPLPDRMVEQYTVEAHSMILSRIAEVYTLPLSEVPDILKLIEKKLAAGLLLDKEYSVGGDETEDSRGRRWIKWAEGMLDKIADGELELLDSNNDVLTQISGQSVDGWPDETTKDADEDDAGGEVQFRMKKEF